MNKVPFLAPDCLDLVLNHLENDKDTLYSCLFLNHIWYNLAAQHLWKDPFSITLSHQKVKLMHIYVASLPHKEICQLNEKGLKIPNLVTPNFKLPYFSYLKRLIYCKLEECALEWLLNEDDPKLMNLDDKFLLKYFEDIKDYDDNVSDDSDEEYEVNESESHSSEESSDDDNMSVDNLFDDSQNRNRRNPMFALHQQALAMAIFKQLLANCNKLDVLDMELFSQNSIVPNIIHIPGCHTTFSDIAKFRFSQRGIYGDVERANIICFWNILGYSSRNISEIEITIDTEVDETHLSNLINVQENLQYLVIRYTRRPLMLKFLHSFLESIPQSLVFLELYNVRLCVDSFKILLGCKNLEEILLIKCYDPHYLNQSQDQVLISEGLKLRKIFWSENNFIHYKYFVSIIESAHNNLQKFEFIPDTYDQKSVINTNEILNALAQFCPNITFLAIMNVHLCFSNLVKLFKSHPWERLTYLTLGSKSNYIIALQELAPHLPTSLHKLRIACKVPADDLKVFFEECQVPIEKLSFPDINHLHTDRHIEIVRDYAKEKRTLKYFGCTYSPNISLELWEKLKEILQPTQECHSDLFYYPLLRYRKF
ncbi:hypothetical protein C1645_746564 [Glomus cerebriforme]|uniref:F-box domain-containing protein n=1 Tax=Glomus cerebriforme TaxID=658196 RepID=A0A397TNG8_9GLOM|nr:hypothetical protein C1645_746564 [Glomus cerebriforme]